VHALTSAVHVECQIACRAAAAALQGLSGRHVKCGRACSSLFAG
jgi:hypothetical protein